MGEYAVSSCVSPVFRLCGGTSNVNILEPQICVVISKELVYHSGNQDVGCHGIIQV